MASISFSYRSPRDPAQIEIRLTFDQDGKEWSQRTRLKFEVSKDFWKDYRKGVNFRDVRKANLKTDLDKHLAEIRTFVLDRYDETPMIGAGWLKETVQRFYNPSKFIQVPRSLIDYWGYYMKVREKELKANYRTWQKHKGTKRKLQRFERDTRKTYLIKEVNEDFKNHFVEWSLKMKYAPDTIKRDLTAVKTICTHAGTKGIETSRQLPRLKTNLKSPKTPKVYLTLEELDRIRLLDGLPSRLDNARDWLIISCYTGQRISDFMRFTPSMIRKNKGREFLDLKQYKTGKNITVPLLPEVTEIIQKHNGSFPRPISSQKYNDYIKEVCRMAGIKTPMSGKIPSTTRIDGKRVKRGISGIYEKWELITSHAGRRSFATNFYGKIPTSYLKDITGHGTESMLLKYIGKTSKETALEAYDLLMKTKDAR